MVTSALSGRQVDYLSTLARGLFGLAERCRLGRCRVIKRQVVTLKSGKIRTENSGELEEVAPVRNLRESMAMAVAVRTSGSTVVQNNSELTSFYETGSQDAFARFEREYGGMVQKWAACSLPRGLACRTEIVEEISQFVFVKVWRTRNSASQWDSGRAQLATWLKTITLRECCSLARRKGGKELLSVDWSVPGMEQEETGFESNLADPESSSPESRLDEEEMQAAFNDALSRFPRQTRRLLQLHFFEGLPYSRIAKMEGLSAASVCRQLKAALGRLKAMLKDWELGA